jgi:hypothetical protein
MFREGELNVRPEFQRFFRWDNTQKSRLVESILLGIPLPSIFVAQDETGKWELVDGLQRVSTLLELQGLLPDEAQALKPALTLIATRFLPALDGRVWESDNGNSLTQAQRLDIKRAKIDVKIIKRNSAEYAKYELFQRLNSYGSQLTPQELRSCLIVSIDPSALDWLESLTELPSFKAAIGLPERLIEEQYDLELALRFLALHALEDVNQRELRSLHQYLDDAAVNFASETSEDDRKTLTEVFTTTFDSIAAAGGETVFRRWNPDRGAFMGAFLTTSFEVIGMGVGYHVANGTSFRTDLDAVAKELWTEHGYEARQSSGKSAERRITENLPLGREIVAA